MKLRWLLVLSMLLPAPAIADRLVDLDQALQRLHAHSSYAWKTTVFPADVSVEVSTYVSPAPDKSGGIRRDSGIVALPIEGSTDRVLGTAMRASLDRNGHNGLRTMRAVIVQGKGVAEMPDGWLAFGELGQAIAALPPIDPRKPGPVSFLQSYSLQTGRMLLALQPPVEELDALLAGSSPPMQAGRSLVATLDPTTAKKFVFELRYRDGFGAVEVMPNFAEGRITIWLKNGEVEKYEVVIDADIATYPSSATAGREHDLHLIKTTTLDKFDRAEVKIPSQAIAKLAGASR